MEVKVINESGRIKENTVSWGGGRQEGKREAVPK